MTAIQAIETKYKGYRFRSRLEARWAVFFDALSIEWEYEKEGFEFGDLITDTVYGKAFYKGCRYLPDFWLPQQGFWFEVKGERPPHGAKNNKAVLLSYHTQQHVVVGYDLSPCIYSPTTETISGGLDWYWPTGVRYSEFYHLMDWGYRASDETYCVTLGLKGSGPPITHFDKYTGDLYCVCTADILEAYTIARSARFEYGETPKL